MAHPLRYFHDLRHTDMKLDLHYIASTYAKSLTASECSQPFMSACDVYKVMDKIYLMAFKLNGIAGINLKVDSIHGEMLRDIYPFIQTGYHMNKKHWISIYEDENMDPLFIEDLIHDSYQLVATKPPQKEKQRLALLHSKHNA